MKSPPELWAELEGDRLADAVGQVTVRPTEHERELAWEAQGARGTARLDPSSWGTKVTLTAEIEDQVARQGFWARMRGTPLPAAVHPDIEARLNDVLDSLNSDKKKPFTRD
ncbi:MAG: hypothetical protein QOJ12_1929 [Thermoleophilales bacterium]|jgi:hypothetical protein|nr:hypothetical protein [Thermoleophilales bacterium]